MHSARFLLIALIAALLLAACSTPAPSIEEIARTQMAADGFAEATITQTVEGDPATRGADELHCVATDATSATGLPYLVLVWRTGESWGSAAMAEGYYEWDLYGCPR